MAKQLKSLESSADLNTTLHKIAGHSLYCRLVNSAVNDSLLL